MNNEEWSLSEIDLIIKEAKDIFEKYSTVLNEGKIDFKLMLNAMWDMNKIMVDMMTKFKAIVELKNKSIISQFKDQIKTSNSFMNKELNYVKKEIDFIKKDDKMECMETLQYCSRDLKKIWIRFANPKEAENLRNANSHAAIEGIFANMNIKLDMAKYPLETFYFQNRKFSKEQIIPETALCCVFVNSSLARIVKNAIRKYNQSLTDDNQMQQMRYNVIADWSFHIRKILKPCIEMKKFDVIQGVLVTNDGLKIYHKEIEHEQRKSKSTFVNSMNQLDILRRKLKDFNYTVPANETYNKVYFNKSFEERKLIRNNCYQNLAEDNVEYEVSDVEVMDD